MYNIAQDKCTPKLPDTLSQEARDFIDKCLKRNPRERLNVTKLLQHPFLRGIPEEKSAKKKMSQTEKIVPAKQPKINDKITVKSDNGRDDTQKIRHIPDLTMLKDLSPKSAQCNKVTSMPMDGLPKLITKDSQIQKLQTKAAEPLMTALVKSRPSQITDDPQERGAKTAAAKREFGWDGNEFNYLEALQTATKGLETKEFFVTPVESTPAPQIQAPNPPANDGEGGEVQGDSPQDFEFIGLNNFNMRADAELLGGLPEQISDEDLMKAFSSSRHREGVEVFNGISVKQPHSKNITPLTGSLLSNS
jgi:serine/threonine protein kinase